MEVTTIYEVSLVLSVLFFCSGFVGLLVEQVLERLLSVIVGGATPAAAVVLATYFAGIALGGWAAAILIRGRTLRWIRAYGFAELGVAAWCVAILAGFDAARRVFGTLLVWAGGDFAWMLVARILIAAVVVLPASLAMGMSFPFLAEIAKDRAGGGLRRLYLTNLTGAAAAACVAPFLLFPALGMRGALLLSVLVDGTVAFAAMRMPSVASTPERVENESATAVRYPLLAVAFGSGLVFFVLEILWTHTVAIVISNSIYAFSAMLFFVTTGLAIGARVANRIREVPKLSTMLWAAAALLLMQMLAWPNVPLSLSAFGHNIEDFYVGEALRWAHLGFLLLPVTIVWGVIYPTLFSDARLEQSGAGATIGYMTALNATGCILGAIAGSFWLLPWMGTERSLRLAVAGIAALGVISFLGELPTRHAAPHLLFAFAIALLAFVAPRWERWKFASGLNVDFRTAWANPQSRLLQFHEDAYGGLTTVVENPASGSPRGVVRTLMTNAKFQGDDLGQMDAQLAFAAIPTLHLSQRRDAFIIGLGTGETAGVLHGLGFHRIEIGELSPGIVEAATRFFGHINHGICANPDVTIRVEDGRNILLARPRAYDLISIEITSVWFAGATNLYSSEFYDLVRSRLSPGGVFQQWLQLHHITPDQVQSIIGTLRDRFQYVSAWFFGGQGVLIASDQPQEIQELSRRAVLDYLRRFESEESAKAKLEALSSSRILNADAVTRLWQSGPVLNTDWNRWLEYSTPRYGLSRQDFVRVNLLDLGRFAH